MAAEMELSKVDNKTKVETMLQEEAAIRQDNKDRELERLADAAEKAARVMTPGVIIFKKIYILLMWSSFYRGCFGLLCPLDFN